jgi:mannose/fructose-specific phosphotransferase system component IIA
VVAHAGLAEALVNCVNRIAGASDALVAISNEGLPPAELQSRLSAAVGPGPAIVFVDLSSGSCALAGRTVAAERSETAVITGVNLPMLLDFVFHRDLGLAELVERVVHKAHAGTTVHMQAGTEASESTHGRR